MKARWWALGFGTGLLVGVTAGWYWTWAQVFDRQEWSGGR